MERNILIQYPLAMMTVLLKVVDGWGSILAEISRLNKAAAKKHASL
jgi:hypothetical protein